MRSSRGERDRENRPFTVWKGRALLFVRQATRVWGCRPGPVVLRRCSSGVAAPTPCPMLFRPFKPLMQADASGVRRFDTAPDRSVHFTLGVVTKMNRVPSKSSIHATAAVAALLVLGRLHEARSANDDGYDRQGRRGSLRPRGGRGDAQHGQLHREGVFVRGSRHDSGGAHDVSSDRCG